MLDGTWRLPPTDRDAKADYEAGHIPGAMFFDLEDFADERSELPHTLPPMEKFVSRVRKLGVGDGHRIVVYDQDGLFSAARVWWMFRYFGHQEVAVLDGGLPAWTAAGGELEDMAPMARDRHFTPRIQTMLLSDVTRVSQAQKLGDVQVVDARGAARFRGDEPEPRPGLRAGHMPGAVNVPYTSLLEEDGRMKPVEELRATLTAAGVDLGKPVITSCGSASPRRSCLSRSSASAIAITVFMTAPGPNGAPVKCCRWRLDDPPRPASSHRWLRSTVTETHSD